MHDREKVGWVADRAVDREEEDRDHIVDWGKSQDLQIE